MSPRSYQRRRRGPVLAVVAVLALAAAVTWTTVLVSPGRATDAVACPASAVAPLPGQTVPADALGAVPPLAPAAVKVTVLNAGGQRGQANLVAAQLGDLGFTQVAPPGNDKAFPDGDMDCVGQIRFGAAGRSAASTLALVVPCAELRQDERPDAGVDLAVGTAFGDLNPSRAIKDALEQLGEAPGATDGDPTAGAAPVVDRATLDAARKCA